jgi:hypothetical protein
MGFNAVKTFTSVSYTRLSDYEQCPLFANYKHLVKLPTPKNDAMQRGADIADATDEWFKGTRRTMPKELAPLKSEYQLIKKDKSTVAEANWGFTRTWEPCSPTDWNRCWLRVKIDIQRITPDGKILKIDDSKTGKYSEYKVAGYEDQLRLYTTTGVIMFPKVQEIQTRLLFSDLGLIHPNTGPRTYTAKEAVAMRKDWERRFKPMMADTKFAPRPGPYCRWCPFSKNATDKDGKPLITAGKCKY